MVWSVLTEDNTPGSGKISTALCNAHTRQYKFTFPELRDEGTKQMRSYFDRNAVPFNMIITTKDMKVVYKKAGALPARLEGNVEAQLE